MDDRQKLRKRTRMAVEVPQDVPKITVNEDNHTDKKIKHEDYTRGDLLTVDLADMINNPLYSDIIITCKDDELHACKSLLAARSEYFNKLLLSSSQQEKKDDYSSNKITIPELTSSAVKVVLEYLYTGNVSDKTLEIDIVSDAYNGATFFLLPNLKEKIVRFMKSYMKHHHNVVSSSNQIAKILSKISGNSIPTTSAKSLSDDDDNRLIGVICKFLMSKSLYDIDYQNLSSKALEFLLSHTLNMKEENVATTEYDIFRYCTLWAVNQISKNDVLYFLLLLPIHEDLERTEVSEWKEWNIDPNNTLLKKHRTTITSILESILKFIDFRLIHPNILANIIEPLKIFDPSVIHDAFRYQAQLVDGFVQTRRGTQK